MKFNEPKDKLNSLFPIGLLLFSFLIIGCLSESVVSGTVKNSSIKKQKGAHVFGLDSTTNFQSIKETNIEWITLVPWGFQNDIDDPKVSHNRGDSLQIKKYNQHWIDRINQTRNAGFKVFLKPHIWIHKPRDGKWRSDIYMKSKVDWEAWKDSYRNFILRYAAVAEAANAEMFCVGTELTKISLENAEFWSTLIKDIRQIYTGKLTYAANWYEEYENISFWKDLDFVGIQAYFPLAKNENASMAEIVKGWQKYIPKIRNIAQKSKRKILFTEIGYKSTSDSAVTPWEWVEDPSSTTKVISNETQANCYQAFFETVWEKEWMAGIHLWQMRGDFAENKRKYFELDFTPQGKPALDILANGFKE